MEYLPTFTINLCLTVGKYSSLMGHLECLAAFFIFCIQKPPCGPCKIKILVFNPSLSSLVRYRSSESPSIFGNHQNVLSTIIWWHLVFIYIYIIHINKYIYIYIHRIPTPKNVHFSKHLIPPHFFPSNPILVGKNPQAKSHCHWRASANNLPSGKPTYTLED